MGNSSAMDRVWPWITNPDMLAISHAWHGHPGTLVKTYPSVGLPVKMAVQVSCGTDVTDVDDAGETTTTPGWSLNNGSLVAPGDAGLCMVGIQNSGVVNENKFSCPPATTSDTTPTQCGNVLFNCTYSVIVLVSKRLKLRLSGSARKSQKTVSRHAAVQTSSRFGSNPAVFIPQCRETGRPIPILSP
eukprot:COSAG06_NODE_371_length_16707_cov_57.805576_28_plen_187_part_00